MSEGIRRRHNRGCPALDGGACGCGGGYEASVYSPRDGKKLRKTFRRESEARSWRAAAKRAIDRGRLRTPAEVTLEEVAQDWLRGVREGTILNRAGRPYKPSTLRGYARSLEDHLLPELGARKLAAISTVDLQRLVDRWQEERVPAASIRNRVKPIQAISRRARSRMGLALNPTHDLELPAARAAEVEILAPEIAAELLAAVPEADQPIWATALYAGLRYGELRALRWHDLDFAAGTIRVRKSWDPVAGEIEPKSQNSKRTTPMPKVLCRLLLAHRGRRGSPAPEKLVFSVADGVPFEADALYRPADAAWKTAKLDGRLRLHQARHTFASFMIAAGVNAKALSVFMGHSSITVTYDIYGHLMPGAEAEGATLLDAFLESRGEKKRRRAA
jgi:integrase